MKALKTINPFLNLLKKRYPVATENTSERHLLSTSGGVTTYEFTQQKGPTCMINTSLDHDPIIKLYIRLSSQTTFSKHRSLQSHLLLSNRSKSKRLNSRRVRTKITKSSKWRRPISRNKKSNQILKSNFNQQSCQRNLQRSISCIQVRFRLRKYKMLRIRI